MELKHILVVSDLQRSVPWYRDVLGATLTGEYGGTSAVFNYHRAWLLVVTPGRETAAKPGTGFVSPPDTSTISHNVTIPVPDCRAAYEMLRARGGRVLN